MHSGLKWSLAAALAVGLSIGVYSGVSAQGDSNQAAVAQRKVTRSFSNAKLAEVLDWLKSQGVNFVVRPDQVASDSRLSLNAVNQPLGDVMKAIAKAFDGAWVKEGELWVFKQGASRNFAFAVPDVTMIPPIALEKMKDFKGFTEKDLENDPEFKKWAEEWKKEWSAKAKEWESRAKELELEFDGPKVRVWTDKDLEKDPEFKKWVEEWKKDAEKWAKEAEKQFGPEFQKRMQERAKAFAERAKKWKSEESELKGSEEMKRAKEFYRQGKAESRAIFVDDKIIREFIETLTAEQWAKQEVQGYLTLADLTDKQRELLRDLPADGTWSITYSIDGKTVKLKGK